MEHVNFDHSQLICFHPLSNYRVSFFLFYFFKEKCDDRNINQTNNYITITPIFPKKKKKKTTHNKKDFYTLVTNSHIFKN